MSGAELCSKSQQISRLCLSLLSKLRAAERIVFRVESATRCMIGARTTSCAIDDSIQIMKSTARKTILAAAAAAFVLPGAASAFNYNYVEGGFVDREIGVLDDSGFRIAGSGQVARQVALIGEYVDTGDFEQLSLGARFFGPLRSVAPNLDWIAAATLEFSDTPVDDDTDFGLRGGVRWGFAQGFEFQPEIVYFRAFDDSFTSLRLAGLFNFQPNLGVQAAFQAGDDDRIEVGMRYSFGPTARR